MLVEMKYGSGVLELELPDERFAGRWGLPAASTPAGAGALRTALAELESAGLARAARGRRVGLLLADGTRERAQEALLPGLLELLAAAAELRVFVCTGTHDPDLPETVALAGRLERLLEPLRLPHRVVVHDARRGPFVRLGTTARGHPVELAAAADECELFVAVSSMKNHYFAGYSNAVKNYAPGIASREYARSNHALALDPRATFGCHPWHPDERRRDNPLAADMVEAMELALGAREHLALAMVSGDGELLWAGGGHTREVSARGMLAVDRLAGVELEPSRFLVVSAGGHPHDESLYTAQRALELTRAAVADGGEVLFLARCANGIGPRSARENFFEPLARPLEQVLEPAPGPYVMYSHKSVKFARYLAGLRAVHLLSDLPAAEVERVHMRPAANAGAVLAAWLAAAAPGDRVAFVDDAAKLAVRAARGRSGQVPMPR